jgi:integrin beta 3
VNTALLDGERYAEIVAAAIKVATAPLLARIVVLEKAQGQAGRDGRDGAPGPAGERGEIGPQGEPGTPGEIGPQGEAGERGERGEIGPQGEPGPAGADGTPGEAGPQGPQGEKGIDGLHGKDGADGLGFDDLEVEHDGARTFSFKFVRGERVKTFGPFKTAALIYRGVFDMGAAYEAGDVVTYGGAMWHANGDSSGIRPDAHTKSAQRAWTLCVMRGREGAKGPKGDGGDRGPQGPQGIPGRGY